MDKNSKQNPGAPLGTELVFIGSPFGGWAQAPVLADGSIHYVGSTEGVEGLVTKQNSNQYAESDGITLFRANRFGHIAPAKIFGAITDAGGVSPHVNQLPLNGANRSAGSSDSWVVLKNGRLVRFSISTTVDVHDITYGHIGGGHDHSAHTAVNTNNPDIFIMTDLASTQVDYAVWSWEDNTDADVGIINLGTPATYVDAWYSALNGATALVKGVPHKMCKGPDGNIYILNGSYVEQVVVTGALTAATKGLELPLGAGWTATGIVSYKNYVAIVASSGIGTTRGESALFLWNGMSTTVNGVTSTAPQYIFPIQDNFVNGINFDGSLLTVFTNGRNASSKIFEFTGKDFKKIFETQFFSPSSTPLQGSLENSQDSMLIGTVKNSLATLCRFYAGGFHDEGTITDGTNNATAVGMVKQFTGNTLYLGISYGTTYQIYFDGNTLSTYQVGAKFRTILYTKGILGRRMYPFGFKGTITRMQIYLSQWGAGASLTLSLFKDYSDSLTSSNDFFTGHPHKTLTTTEYPAGTTEIDLTDLSFTNISSFYMIFTFDHASTNSTAAIIRYALVHVSPSQ